ncbi:PaaX family transcriptional regulator [Kitasatospora phosalacinea]|uniref:PaaX family transcriptional regulator n=1 Tax=Kitasatospora phosalacinea TaxID=2065 RepID=A0A9W6V656_9ACTN|nr:PaaX family transcriptional regulator C-terminal domain-containing protein [Kitasatospora phosalacinea]GLW73805.1 PaaX family transcriptional regulator [Kitasatospora phosalacinea]
MIDLDPAPRPQSLMLTFFGVHVLGRDVALSSGCVIEVFERVGVTEEAVRSTLTRMVNRGLLARHRQGRKMYFGLTPRAVDVLRDGHQRVWNTGAVNRDWRGQWTLVGFSLPEAWRRQRHDLRSRLTWGGFGPLQNGLWVAPGEVDVAALLGDLELDAHLRVFRGTVLAPTEVAQVVESAFDTAAIAAGYRAFLERWGDGAGADGDPVRRQLLLHTDWLELVRTDPHLPAEHLPADWPAIRAEELFRGIAREVAPAAAEEAARLLDTIGTG